MNRVLAAVAFAVLGACSASSTPPPDAGDSPDASIPPVDAGSCLDTGSAIISGPDGGASAADFGGLVPPGYRVCLEPGERFTMEYPANMRIELTVSAERAAASATVLRAGHELAAQSLRSELAGWAVFGPGGGSLVFSLPADAGRYDVVQVLSSYTLWGAGMSPSALPDGGVGFDARPPTSDWTQAPVFQPATPGSQEVSFVYWPLEQLGAASDCEARPLEARFFRAALDAGSFLYRDYTVTLDPYDVVVLASDGGVLASGLLESPTLLDLHFTLGAPDVVAFGFRQADAGLVASCAFDGGARPALYQAEDRTSFARPE